MVETWVCLFANMSLVYGKGRPTDFSLFLRDSLMCLTIVVVENSISSVP